MNFLKEKSLLILFLTLSFIICCDASYTRVISGRLGRPRIQSPVAVEYFSSLPDPCIVNILEQEDWSVRDLVRLSLSCHRFGNILKVKPVSLEDFEGVPKNINTLKWILGKFNNIDSLGLSHFGDTLTNEDLLAIVQLCPDLVGLDLTDCKNITDTGIGHLAILQKLISLNLKGCNKISIRCLAHLNGIRSLECLTLDCCKTDEDLDHLPTNLKMLKVYFKELTNAGLARLNRLVNLKELEIVGGDRTTNEGLALLPRNLECLTLDCCKTDEDLDHLPTNLKMLKICFKGLTNAGLARLNRLVSLKVLEIVGGDQITNEGLALLPRGLESLLFDKCSQLTDVSLLSSLAELRSLLFCNCDQLTDDGLVNLRIESLKNFYFCWDSYETVPERVKGSGLIRMVTNCPNLISLASFFSLETLLKIREIRPCMYFPNVTEVTEGEEPF